MPKQQKKQEKDPIYVGIYDAKKVQKNLLQSSKSVIHLVKEYDTIVSIREKKIRAFKQYDALMAEVRQSISELKKHMPVHTLKEPEQSSVDEPLDGLDKELAMIEQKLKQLG